MVDRVQEERGMQGRWGGGGVSQSPTVFLQWRNVEGLGTPSWSRQHGNKALLCAQLLPLLRTLLGEECLTAAAPPATAPPALWGAVGIFCLGHPKGLHRPRAKP